MRRRTILKALGLGTLAGITGGCDAVGSVFGRMFAIPSRETTYFTPNAKFYVVNYADSAVSMSRDINIEQVWQQGGIDLQKLASELEQLKEALDREATNAEHRMSVSAIEVARESAQKNDGPKTLQYLKIAGKWAFEIAGRIGVHEVSEALKKVL